MDIKSMKLPSNWLITSLDSICEILDSKRIPINNTERNARIAGKESLQLYAYYGATGKVGEIDSFIFEGEYVLVGEDGAPFLEPAKLKAYIAIGKFWVNNHAHILKSYTSNKYLCHYLNQFNYSDFVTGTTRLKLNQAALKSIPVVFAPLNEQTRIVAKIEELFSELDNGIAALKTARKQLKVYRQAVLKHAFEGKFTAKWREENADKLETPEQLLTRIQQERDARYQQQLEEWQAAVKMWEVSGKEGKKPAQPKKLKQSPLGLVERIITPKEWRYATLGDLNADVFDGPFGSNLKSSDYVDNGVRVIRLENIGEMQFIEDKYSFVSEEKYQQIQNHTVSSGNIIFSSFITEGIRVVILPPSIDKAINKADCFCIRTFGESYDTRFLAFYLSSRAAFKQIESEIHGIGRPRINTTQLKSFVVPVCGIEEQRQILAKIDLQVSELDATASNIKDQLLKAETLRQSILKKAFSGQLVPQDPNDEPASELLARIKAEKTAQVTSTRKATKRATLDFELEAT